MFRQGQTTNMSIWPLRSLLPNVTTSCAGIVSLMYSNTILLPFSNYVADATLLEAKFTGRGSGQIQILTHVVSLNPTLGAYVSVVSGIPRYRLREYKTTVVLCSFGNWHQAWEGRVC